MKRQQGAIYIGISGWRYGGWRGVFYSKGMPQKHELRFASRLFSSIELNGSFYSLQRPENYQEWKDETPSGFRFAVKGGRFITHMKKLRDVETATANFFASGVLALEEKLGPILWQLPPQLAFDAEKLERFFAVLPHTTKDAVKLASGHDHRLEGRSHLVTKRNSEIKHVVEVRHATFETPEFMALLRKHHVGNVVADTAKRWPLIEDLSGGIGYVRLHGDEELYASGYSSAALKDWAKRILHWSRGEQKRTRHCLAEPCAAEPHDVYVYFDNDAKVHAPFDALALAGMLRAMGGDVAAAPGLAGDSAVGKYQLQTRAG